MLFFMIFDGLGSRVCSVLRFLGCGVGGVIIALFWRGLAVGMGVHW